MTRRQIRLVVAAVTAVIVVLVGGRALVGLYTDVLWYHALGYASVYWTRLEASVVVQVVATIIAGGLVLLNLGFVVRRLGAVHLRRRYGNLEIAEQVPRQYLVALIVLAALLAGWWLAELEFGGEAGVAVLAWMRHVPWGASDPEFHKDISFFVFSFPIYERVLDFLLVTVLWSAILASIGYSLLGMLRWEDRRPVVAHTARLHLVGLAAIVILLLAGRLWLDRYGVLLAGPDGWVGYTDILARLPAYAALAAVAFLVALAVAYSGWRARWLPALVGLCALLAGAVLLLQLYPLAIEKLRVEPNQLASETPYIRWSLRFTDSAYGLQHLERQKIPYSASPLPPWDSLVTRIGELARWDPEQLKQNFNQSENIYNYYRFDDVAFDRYGPRGSERPVAISVREVEPGAQPAATRTWQSMHLNTLYLRGLGAVVVPVADSASEPVYWLHNLNPVTRSSAAPASLTLVNPSVYFGERTSDYAILTPGRDSALIGGEPGRDYPAGVRLGSFTRLLAFAWRFGEKNLLFSDTLSDSSRIVFRRSVLVRLRELARWVVWDSSPCPVLYDGHIIWIVDGYTASGTYPLARAVDMPDVGRIRYIRNSIKATVDAATGAVRLYAMDPRDPVLRTFERVFPGLVHPLDDMPATLRAHLRYPVRLLKVQAGILEQYHLPRADQFFAGQDFWSVAQEAGSQGVPRPFQPTYSLVELPGDTVPEFILVLPFVARQRHNMTALLVAHSDGARYGQLDLMELPRDQQVPGPTQVHSLIEQDPVISQTLSLWRQRGSEVDVGHLRLVPVDSGLFYMVPLFLTAQQPPIPELARIVVSDGRDVAMAEDLQTAVERLRRGKSPGAGASAAAGTPVVPGVPHADWAGRALQLMGQAQDRLKAGDWAGFGKAWSALQDYLKSLNRTVPPQAGRAHSGGP